MNHTKELPEQILQRVKDEVAKEEGYECFDDYSSTSSYHSFVVTNEIARRYHAEMLKALVPSDADINFKFPEGNLHMPDQTYEDVRNVDRRIGARWMRKQITGN